MTVDASRRPLKSREKSWAKAIAKALIDRKVNPNHISLTGMLFAVLGGLSFLMVLWVSNKMWYVAAAVFIQLRLLCNMLDGMVAVDSGAPKSKLGDLFNELPDRFEDIVLLVGAGYSLCVLGPILGLSAAVVAVLTAYIRAFGASVGTKQYFQGPMAKPHRMAVLTLGCLLEAFASTYGYWIVTALNIIIAGGLITCVRRINFIVKELKHK